MSAHRPLASADAPATKRARPIVDLGVAGTPSHQLPAAHRVPSLNALPRDLLRLLFSYLPHYMRLCHVAPVCKRWCDAARGSITRQPQGMTLSCAVRLLPSLQHARLQYVDDGRVMPPQTLRSLHITKETAGLCAASQCLLQRATHLTGLTALKFHGFGSCKHLDHLVTSLATQLTQLDLPYLMHGPLCNLSFPALKSLAAARGVRLIANSCLTLTSLSLSMHGNAPLPVFPCVHTLAITSLADIADALKLHFPSLTTIRMLGPLHSPLPAYVSSAVAALHVSSLVDHIATHLAHVTSLTVSLAEKNLAWLEGCTSLTSLHIEVVTMYEGLARLRLPRLRKLVISEGESHTWPICAFDNALELLHSTVQGGKPPRTMHLNVWPEVEKLEALLQLLQQAEGLGMETLLVPDSPAAVHVVRAARERLAWLHVGLNAYPGPTLKDCV